MSHNTRSHPALEVDSQRANANSSQGPRSSPRSASQRFPNYNETLMSQNSRQEGYSRDYQSTRSPRDASNASPLASPSRSAKPRDSNSTSTSSRSTRPSPRDASNTSPLASPSRAARPRDPNPTSTSSRSTRPSPRNASNTSPLASPSRAARPRDPNSASTSNRSTRPSPRDASNTSPLASPSRDPNSASTSSRSTRPNPITANPEDLRRAAILNNTQTSITRGPEPSYDVEAQRSTSPSALSTAINSLRGLVGRQSSPNTPRVATQNTEQELSSMLATQWHPAETHHPQEDAREQQRSATAQATNIAQSSEQPAPQSSAIPDAQQSWTFPSNPSASSKSSSSTNSDSSDSIISEGELARRTAPVSFQVQASSSQAPLQPPPQPSSVPMQPTVPAQASFDRAERSPSVAQQVTRHMPSASSLVPTHVSSLGHLPQTSQVITERAPSADLQRALTRTPVDQIPASQSQATQVSAIHDSNRAHVGFQVSIQAPNQETPRTQAPSVTASSVILAPTDQNGAIQDPNPVTATIENRPPVAPIEARPMTTQQAVSNSQPGNASSQMQQESISIGLRPDEGHQGSLTCSICHQEVDNNAILLDCGHKLHRTCLQSKIKTEWHRMPETNMMNSTWTSQGPQHQTNLGLTHFYRCPGCGAGIEASQLAFSSQGTRQLIIGKRDFITAILDKLATLGHCHTAQTFQNALAHAQSIAASYNCLYYHKLNPEDPLPSWFSLFPAGSEPLKNFNAQSIGLAWEGYMLRDEPVTPFWNLIWGFKTSNDISDDLISFEGASDIMQQLRTTKSNIQQHGMQSPPRAHPVPQGSRTSPERPRPAASAPRIPQGSSQTSSNQPPRPVRGQYPLEYRIGHRGDKAAFFVWWGNTEYEVLWYQITIRTRPRRNRPSEERGGRYVLAEDRSMNDHIDRITTRPMSDFDDRVREEFDSFCIANQRDPELVLSRSPDTGLPIHEDRDFLEDHPWDEDHPNGMKIVQTWHVPGTGSMNTRITYVACTTDLDRWDGTIFDAMIFNVTSLRTAYDYGRAQPVEKALQHFRNLNDLDAPTIPSADYEAHGMSHPHDARPSTANRRLSARLATQRANMPHATAQTSERPTATSQRRNANGAATAHGVNQGSNSPRPQRPQTRTTTSQSHVPPMQQPQTNVETRADMDAMVRDAVRVQMEAQTAQFSAQMAALQRSLQDSIASMSAAMQTMQNSVASQNQFPTPRPSPER